MGGPIVIGVRRKVTGGPIITTIHGLRIDWAIHGPTVIGIWRTVIGVPILTINIGVRRQAIGGPILTTNLMRMCTTAVVIITTSTMVIILLYKARNQHQRVQLSQKLYTHLNCF